MLSSGFAGKLLHYIVICQVQHSTGTPYSNQWTYKSEDWAVVDSHEDWFLHSATPVSKANRIQSSTNWFYMDPGSAGWQAWVTLRAKEIKTNSYFGYNGIFLDNVELSWTKPYNSSGQHLYAGNGIRIDSSTAYVARVISFLANLRTAIGTDPLWGNMISGYNTGSEWNNHMRYLDGAMHEAAIGWDATYLTSTQQVGVLSQLEWCNINNKGWIFAGQGESTDTQKAAYALANYLLVKPNTGIAAFRYTKTSEYTIWREIDNLNIILGDALDTKNLRNDGINGFIRHFQFGTVSIDLDNHVGEITIIQPDEHIEIIERLNLLQTELEELKISIELLKTHTHKTGLPE
jgi:hypothetical protein